MKVKNEKRNPWELFLWILNAVLVIIILILLLLNGRCHKQLSDTIEKQNQLEKEVFELKLSLSKNDSIIQLLTKQNEFLVKENSRLSKNLETVLGIIDNSHRRENSLKAEIYFMKNEINKLNQKVDSLENGFSVSNPDSVNFRTFERESLDSSNFPETNFVTKKTSFIVTKKVSNKKHVISSSEILNYSSNIVFVKNHGFLENSYSRDYKYLNENSDSVKISFNTFAEGKIISMYVKENEDDFLCNFENEFSLGAGGLLIQLDSPLPWHEKIVHTEKLINYKLKRQATWEILGGVFAGGVGGIGLWYFNKYPEAIMQINDFSGDLIFQDEISNNFGKAVSAGLIGVGSTLVIKGVVDKFLSVKIYPTEIGIVYTFQNK